MKKPDFRSASGRTSVTVEVGADGKGTIFVDQDGRRVHRFDIPKEQDGPQD
jgi:hypothetical protein